MSLSAGFCLRGFVNHNVGVNVRGVDLILRSTPFVKWNSYSHEFGLGIFAYIELSELSHQQRKLVNITTLPAAACA